MTYCILVRSCIYCTVTMEIEVHPPRIWTLLSECLSNALTNSGTVTLKLEQMKIVYVFIDVLGITARLHPLVAFTLDDECMPKQSPYRCLELCNLLQVSSQQLEWPGCEDRRRNWSGWSGHGQTILSQSWDIITRPTFLWSRIAIVKFGRYVPKCGQSGWGVSAVYMVI